MHVKTKNVDENEIKNKGLTMLLESDAQAKDERLNCTRENERKNKLVVGNEELKCGKLC